MARDKSGRIHASAKSARCANSRRALYGPVGGSAGVDKIGCCLFLCLAVFVVIFIAIVCACGAVA